MRLHFLMLVAFAGAGCISPPPAAPDPVSACAPSCEILTDLECPEGNATCVPDCERVAGTGYLWRDDSSGPLCVVASEKTVEAVRACNVRCAP